MDPAKKESILGDLRMANEFFDTAKRLPDSTLGASPTKKAAIAIGYQLLQIAIARMKEES